MSYAEISAELSRCGRYRWRLVRRWDGRPMLLVVMFNPSTADHRVDDKTIIILCEIARHNGYGGIVVVNLIPLRSPTPDPAVAMTRWEKVPEWSDRDLLLENLQLIRDEVRKAGSVLVAWGTLGGRCPEWSSLVLDAIREELPAHGQLLCLAKTTDGHPKHPMARGKHKVPKDAPLIPWS